MRLSLLAPALACAQALSRCKTTPLDPEWPSHEEWMSLNASMNGALVRTKPVASSCWPGNSFGSKTECGDVTANWSNSTWHSMQPESISYQFYANNSCLPKGVAGYTEEKGCSIGALPQYIVNATQEEHVAMAMKWASDRNIRIVVKGTGHDLNGRSSGAFSLSIWTRNFCNITRDTAWRPSCNSTTTNDVFIVGSGQQWGNVLENALSQGRVVTTGQSQSVGLGGYISGGGHGPLSRTYGLAASQVLQVRVVTATGQILVANDYQNQDLFWAVRGGGGGQYGVVTEYVIKHYPAPSNVTTAVVQIRPSSGTTNNSAEASWDAVARFLGHLPDLMDKGLAGAATVSVGEATTLFFPGLKLEDTLNGVAIRQIFWAFNSTPAAVEALVAPVLAELQSQANKLCGAGNGTNSPLFVEMTTSSFDNYTSFYAEISGDNNAGGEGVSSSRLLGRHELTETPHSDIVANLKIALNSWNTTAGNYATIGLQGGPGVRDTPDERWGALLPAWRPAYLHFIANGAPSDSQVAGSPKLAMQSGADWFEKSTEKMWRKWSPDSGAYMNEANPFNKEFKKDFYGAGYARLQEVKRKYDPNESLFVLSGVGSDAWDYDLDSGKLCRV